MSQLRRLLPSLNTLVAFEAVVRCGTFASAARELGVTSPAVSRTIGRLELHLGLPLFRRTPSGAILTKDGDELFSGISRSFGEIEGTLVRLKQRSRSIRKPITLSVSSAFATHWFMPRLAQFQSSFPEEEVQFELIGGPLGGPAGHVDIAMRFDHRAEPDEQVRALMPELLLPISAPDFQIQKSTMEELFPAITQMITLNAAHPDSVRLFAPSQLRPDAKELRFSDYSLVVQAALLGQGIALGWLNVVSQLLVQRKLVPASMTLLSTKRQCQLVTRRNASRIVDRVCEWLVSEYKDDAQSLSAIYPQLGIKI